MNLTESFCLRNRKWILLLLLVLSYPLFFYKLGDRDIWSPDEDEYVQVNREMVLDGHWIYPTANGQPYTINPPLFNWLGSAFAKLNGEVTEHTSRLPSALAASAGILILYFIGTKLFGHRTGLLSALIIGTTPIYIEFGRWIQINMISTMLLTATLALFYWGYRDERKRAPAYLLMYVPVGLGTLNMGLVDVVMPMIVIGLYLIAEKDVRHILKLRIGWGILVFLSARCILPLLLASDKNGKEAAAFPVPVGGGSVRFFSIAQTKRSEYLLPIFPAMALLVAYVIDRSLRLWDESFTATFFFSPTILHPGFSRRPEANHNNF